MASSILTPVTLALTTALADLTAAVGASKVRSYDIRVANVHASLDANVDLVLTNGTIVINRLKNYPVPFNTANSAPDLELRIVIPTGWYFRAKASINSALEVSAVGVEDDA